MSARGEGAEIYGLLGPHCAIDVSDSSKGRLPGIGNFLIPHLAAFETKGAGGRGRTRRCSCALRTRRRRSWARIINSPEERRTTKQRGAKNVPVVSPHASGRWISIEPRCAERFCTGTSKLRPKELQEAAKQYQLQKPSRQTVLRKKSRHTAAVVDSSSSSLALVPPAPLLVRVPPIFRQKTRRNTAERAQDKRPKSDFLLETSYVGRTSLSQYTRETPFCEGDAILNEDTDARRRSQAHRLGGALTSLVSVWDARLPRRPSIMAPKGANMKAP